MPEIALALLVVCAAACAPADSGTHSRSPGQDQDATAHTITAAPTTVRMELGAGTRDALTRALGAHSLEVARLILRDIRPHEARALKGVRVFVEKPDAELGTSIDDPHYAGSFALGLAPPETVLINIAPALARLWDLRAVTADTLGQRGLRLTLIAEPMEPASRMPPGFAVTIQSIHLELPR